MVRVRRHPGRHAQDLDVERMPLHQVGRGRLATERDRNLLAEALEPPVRRPPRILGDVVGVDLAHYLGLRWWTPNLFPSGSLANTLKQTGDSWTSLTSTPFFCKRSRAAFTSSTSNTAPLDWPGT